MDPTTDRGQQLLDEIASLDVQRARIEADIASRMLEFADQRRRESERHTDPLIQELEAGFAADELSLVVKQPTRTVHADWLTLGVSAAVCRSRGRRSRPAASTRTECG